MAKKKDTINPQPSKGDTYQRFTEPQTKVEMANPPLGQVDTYKSFIAPQFQTLGDATFCSTCKSNTKYKGECAVCGIPSDENALRYRGNLEFLRVKYPQYIK